MLQALGPLRLKSTGPSTTAASGSGAGDIRPLDMIA